MFHHSSIFDYRLAVILSLFIGILLFAWKLDATTMESWITAQASMASAWFVVVGVIMMSTFVPKTAVAVSAGALFGTTTGFLLLVVIATLAAMINYALGRWWFHGFDNRRAKQTSRTNRRTAWTKVIREMAAEAGVGGHLLVRLSPIPTMLISYTMGASGARVGPYMIAAVLAVIPQAIWVHSGSTTMASLTTPSTNLWAVVSMVVAVVIAITLSILIPREAMRRLAHAV